MAIRFIRLRFLEYELAQNHTKHQDLKNIEWKDSCFFGTVFHFLLRQVCSFGLIYFIFFDIYMLIHITRNHLAELDLY
jgi:hypothetical protein